MYFDEWGHTELEGTEIDNILIPFGLRKLDGKFCDIAHVPRGKKCGCICPSCKAPLIARQGRVKHWHFAHASRQVFLETQKNCVYSFFVAVRMMARQTIGEQIEITLPACKGEVSEYLANYQKHYNEQFTVAEKQKITISNMEVERSFLGIPVDVYGLVDNFNFIIYFTHRGREIPQALRNPSDTKCGIIGVSLDRLHSIYFMNGEKSTKSYLTILNDFLVNDLSSKQWIFHPRFRRLEELARLKLAEKVKDLKLRSNFGIKESKYPLEELVHSGRLSIELPAEKPKKLAVFECLMCATEWQGLHPSGSVCPTCNSLLYKRKIRYVDPEN